MTEADLLKLEELAAALMPPDEIAILLGIPAENRSGFVVQCTEIPGCEAYEAFQRGKLTTKKELRQNIIRLAKAGSPAAEPLALRFISESK